MHSRLNGRDRRATVPAPGRQGRACMLRLSKRLDTTLPSTPDHGRNTGQKETLKGVGKSRIAAAITDTVQKEQLAASQQRGSTTLHARAHAAHSPCILTPVKGTCFSRAWLPLHHRDIAVIVQSPGNGFNSCLRRGKGLQVVPEDLVAERGVLGRPLTTQKRPSSHYDVKVVKNSSR